MSFVLDGKVALVTGGSRGIGKAIALAFSKAGADVGIVGRDRSALNLTLGELRKRTARAEAFVADLSKLDELENMIEMAKSKLGSLTFL